MRARTTVATALALVVVAGGAATAADDYSDPAYLQHDADNYARARGSQVEQATSTTYTPAFLGAAADSMARAAGKQANDVRKGRVYGGFSPYTGVYGTTGDPEIYFDLVPRRVQFLARTGAKLQGHVWNGEAAGTRPGVVITPGSIQGSDQMYWWAAHALAARGYVVMTWDAQGQGQSETFGHEAGSFAPTAEGVPFQQEKNFVDGTVDALGFFLSTPQRPYVPTGWSADEVAAARAAAQGEQMDWSNPGAAHLDRTRLGIAGHSLGARAVSVVQQCSDAGTVWRTTEACAGRSFPIKAVVGWDNLSSEGVVPVVPGMDQSADGYFLSPTPTPSAPDPTDALGTYEAWRKAGLDSMVTVVRAGTHLEWSRTPYIGPSTAYGTDQAAYYTAAWMDRFVPRDPATRRRGYAALLAGPKADAALPWSANHLSARRLSAFSLRAGDGGGRPTVTAGDLRAWAGRSPVGDWAGANADTAGSPAG